MKNITTFLLGGLVFISFAAATTNIMTVRPATPKQVYSKIIWNDEIEGVINNAVKKGWIVKSASISADRSGGATLLIMEKY